MHEQDQPKDTQDIAEISKLGYQLMKQGDLDGALAAFHKGYGVDPANGYILIGLGDATRKTKDFNGSLRWYREVLEREPDNRFALLGIGDAYRGLKDFENCLVVWNRYIEKNPHDYSILTRIADAHKKLGRRSLAIEFYERALEANQANKFALMGLGDLYYKEQRYGDTLKYWERLLEIEPKLINIITMVGNIYRKQHNFARAADWFRKALDVAPHNSYAVFGMADSLRGMGRCGDATPYWDEIVRMDPENKKVLTRAGDCFFRTDDLSRAEELFERALKIGYDKFAVYGLSRIYRRRGQYDLAVENYRGILVQDPMDMRTVILLGETIGEAQGIDEATRYFREKLAEYPGHREIENALTRLEINKFSETTEHMP